MQQVRNPWQGHEMVLHVLSCSEVRFSAGELVRHSGQLPHLPDRQSPTGNLGADHMHSRLPLAINSPPQPPRTELIVGHLSRKETVGRPTEVLNVVSDDSVVFLFGELLTG